MLANPIVEELILAGDTSNVARVMFEIDANGETVLFEGVPYSFGRILMYPPLKAAQRFRAFVTWLPTGET